MPATSKYHITIANSAGTFGFITKQYSSRQKPDTLFGSRFSTGDISYSTMSRWQRFAQTSWIGGAFQKYLEDRTKFRLSRDIDVLTNGEFKLSRKISAAALYAGSTPIYKGIRFNGATYFSDGRYIRYTTDDYATVNVSKDFGVGKVCTDLEIYNGELWAAVGTHGLWHHDTSDHTTWTEKQDAAVTVPCDYLQTWGDNLYLVYTNLIKYFDATNFTTVRDFSSGGDSVYYIKKPQEYAGAIYFPINVAATDGAGELWYYNGTTLDIVYSGYDPIGQEIIVYDSLLFFVVYGFDTVTIKTYNGATVGTLQSFEVAAGITLYGSGLTYGSGALYGAGSDNYLDPVHFAIWKNHLVAVMQRTTTQNTILLYDTIGWTEHISLPVGANYSASLWLEDRSLFIGGSDGDIYKVEVDFASTGFLQASIWDADLQDINKLFADVIIKHEPLQAGDSIDVWYRGDAAQNFVFLGTADTDGAIQSTISFPTGDDSVVTTAFEYRLILNSANGSTTPVVKDLILRYILSPENSKRVFEYTIECTKKMKLLDNTFEEDTPSEMIANLWALKTSGELLTLVDEEGDSHTVVFSDTTPEVVTPFAGDTNMEKYVYIRLFEL